MHSDKVIYNQALYPLCISSAKDAGRYSKHGQSECAVALSWLVTNAVFCAGAVQYFPFS